MTYVLYHDNCYDGFGAAYAAFKALGRTNVKYIPVKHSDPIPQMEFGSRVYILDFSYARDVMEQASQSYDLIVLDHHATAEKELAGLSYVTFDMNKSGAILAWEYFHDGPPPKLLQYVQDRDLWRFYLPCSKLVNAALQLYPMQFEIWDLLNVDDLVTEGKVALALKEQTVAMICKQTYKFMMPENECVPVVNATAFWSEVGDKLLQLHPDAKFCASWYKMGNGGTYWSLRSRGEFDVGAYAKRQGGGGHRSAAGFILQ